MKIAAPLLVVALCFVALHEYLKPRVYPAGVLISEEPMQTELASPLPIVQKAGFAVTPLARFSIAARVLHKKIYWSDPVAKLAPYDLAVGWGPMSDQSVLDRLEISQGNRFFFWQYQNSPPIPTDQIITHATNMHLIPANERVSRQIGSTRTGDLIRLTGYLIEASAPSMSPWRSSLTRADTGKGACEIVLVQSIEPYSTGQPHIAFASPKLDRLVTKLDR